MIIYDKLKNLDTEEDKFDFICPECGVNGMKKGNFTIKPIGVPWAPDFLNNSDIENTQIRNYYNKSLTLRKAIESVFLNNTENQLGLNIFCNNCNNHLSIYKKIDLPLMRKWMNKNLPKYLDLGIKK